MCEVSKRLRWEGSTKEKWGGREKVKEVQRFSVKAT